MAKKRLVIVGNGMAASRLLDDLLQRGAQQRYTITVFGEEQGGCYNRIMLSKVLTGHDPEAILLKPTDWYAARGVELVEQGRVTRLDTAGRVVHTADDKTVRYDVAVLATGSVPFVPPMDGMARPDGRWKTGLYVYRTLDDCLQIRSSARAGDNAVVLGGGLLGLEAAKSLSDLGLHVTVVQLSETLMNVQLDKHGAEMLRRQIQRCGIFVRTGRRTQAVLGTDAVEGVLLDDGRSLPADLVVLACGIRPRVDVAKASDIPVKTGILVNDTLATEVPGVYAIGECAEHNGKIYGIVAPIWEQATILADVLTGANPQARYRGSKLYARLKVAEVAVASMGVTEPVMEHDEVIQVIEDRKAAYRKMIVRDGKLVGAMLVGDAEAAPTLVQMFDRSDLLPANRLDALCSLTGGETSGRAKDRNVCDCHKVRESVIVEAIQGGACSVEAVGECTRAGTGCGSCKGQIEQLVTRHAELSVANAAKE